MVLLDDAEADGDHKETFRSSSNSADHDESADAEDAEHRSALRSIFVSAHLLVEDDAMSAIEALHAETRRKHEAELVKLRSNAAWQLGKMEAKLDTTRNASATRSKHEHIVQEQMHKQALRRLNDAVAASNVGAGILRHELGETEESERWHAMKMAELTRVEAVRSYISGFSVSLPALSVLCHLPFPLLTPPHVSPALEHRS